MQIPPLHPAIVHFPIALIVAAFFADLVGRKSSRPSVRNFGFGCLILATALGVITLIAGYVDMVRLPPSPAHEYVHIHMYSGFILAGVLVLLTLWRWRIFRSPTQSVKAGYLAFSALLLALTLFQGWYGGEMVFSQGVGVAAASQGVEDADKAQRRLATVSKLLTGKEFERHAVGAPPASQTGGTNSSHHR